MSDATVWTVILLLAAGSYLIRLSFLGLVGGRRLPDWLMAPLRYTTVAVLPALVAPIVVWPAATASSSAVRPERSRRSTRPGHERERRKRTTVTWPKKLATWRHKQLLEMFGMSRKAARAAASPPASILFRYN